MLKNSLEETPVARRDPTSGNTPLLLFKFITDYDQNLDRILSKLPE